MVKYKIRVAGIILAGLIVRLSPLHAGGMLTNTTSASSAAMAGTATGIGSDVSSVFSNPGAMTFQEYSKISAGVVLSNSSTSFLSPFVGNTDDETGMAIAPLLFGVYKLNDKMAVGLSVNTPFSSRKTWNDNWTGSYISRESVNRAICIQPTFGISVSEKIGIGIGAVIALGRDYKTRAMPYSSSSGPVNGSFESKGTAYGFNLGLFFNTSEKFKMGLNYRSALNFKIDNGEAEFTNVPSGASYMLTHELLLAIDFTYAGWNVYDKLEYDFADNPELNFTENKDYSNGFALRFGSSYKISEKLTARGGVAFDNSPVPDESMLPDNPDSDRFIFSLGGNIKFNEKTSLDLFYQLENYKEREVSNTELRFAGSYKTNVNNFGLAINYQF
ncbi:MAG: outer membrane protein transport protein [Bacteroidetes bacterium]|nr:outer membrane protein transport protein [Bacteroidota bacterium]